MGQAGSSDPGPQPDDSGLDEARQGGPTAREKCGIQFGMKTRMPVGRIDPGMHSECLMLSLVVPQPCCAASQGEKDAFEGTAEDNVQIEGAVEEFNDAGLSASPAAPGN